MIAFDEELCAFCFSDAIEIGQRVFESHRPTCVASDDHKIVFTNQTLPGIENLLVVIQPVLAETVHCLARPAREVKISDREYSHSG